MLIASLVVDGFNATEGWRFFTYLAIGYMISRGLAKSGSRDPTGQTETTETEQTTKSGV